MNTAMSRLSFRQVQFDVVDRSGQPWLKANQVGQALGYSRPDAINTLYQSNADEFTAAMTALVKLRHGNDGAGQSQMREIRIFSLRGCHLLGMFARTEIAKEFRKWVLDILDQQPSVAPARLPIRSRADLSFTQRDELGRLRNWVVAHIPGRDWHVGVEIGKGYFDEVLELARHNPNEARWAIQNALMDGAATNFQPGHWGIECGFAEAIALALFGPGGGVRAATVTGAVQAPQAAVSSMGARS